MRLLVSTMMRVLQEKVPQYADQSGQYFSLLCVLLNWAQIEQPLSNGEARLKNEIEWLKKARVRTLVNPFKRIVLPLCV